MSNFGKMYFEIVIFWGRNVYLENKENFQFIYNIILQKNLCLKMSFEKMGAKHRQNLKYLKNSKPKKEKKKKKHIPKDKYLKSNLKLNVENYQEK